MRIITTTTYIGKDGEIQHVRKEEKRLYYNIVLSTVRQTAVIKNMEGGGMKITVTRIEPDPQ